MAPTSPNPIKSAAQAVWRTAPRWLPFVLPCWLALLAKAPPAVVVLAFGVLAYRVMAVLPQPRLPRPGHGILAVLLMGLWLTCFSLGVARVFPLEHDVYLAKAFSSLLVGLLGLLYFQLLPAVACFEPGNWGRLLYVSQGLLVGRSLRVSCLQLGLLVFPYLNPFLWPIFMALTLALNVAVYSEARGPLEDGPDRAPSDGADIAPKISLAHTLFLGIGVLIGCYLILSPTRPPSLPRTLQFRQTPSRGMGTITIACLLNQSGRYPYVVSLNGKPVSKGELEAAAVQSLADQLKTIGLTPSFQAPTGLGPDDEIFQVALTSSDDKVLWGTWALRDPRSALALRALQEVPPLAQGLSLAQQGRRR